MTDPTDLALPSRAGLPDAIAYLRAAHPAARWPTHANYGDLAAFWLGVHASLRAEAAGTAPLLNALRTGELDPRSFQAAFVPRLNQFLQHLTMHHRIEDSAYFPRFRALDPRMVAGFDLLEADHHVIDAALRDTVESARALLAALPGERDGWRFAADAHDTAAQRLAALLTRHLADEEELVIPALLEHGERSVA